MASYNSNILTQQIQDLSRQYQQLLGNVSQFQQPQQNFIPQQPPASRQVQYVDGMNGAVLYQSNMQPNTSEIVMDKSEDIFYVVSKDANGTPARKIIHGHFTIDDDEQQDSIYVTKKDLDTLKQDLIQFFSTQKSQQTHKAEKESQSK